MSKLSFLSYDVYLSAQQARAIHNTRRGMNVKPHAAPQSRPQAEERVPRKQLHASPHGISCQALKHVGIRLRNIEHPVRGRRTGHGKRQGECMLFTSSLTVTPHRLQGRAALPHPGVLPASARMQAILQSIRKLRPYRE